MYSMSRATGIYRTRFYASDFTLKIENKAATPDEVVGRPKYERIDWEGMADTAMLGKIPTPPELRTNDKSRWALLRDIEKAAIAGDMQTLGNINVGDYNTVIRMIAKYRLLCLLALDQRRILSLPPDPCV